ELYSFQYQYDQKHGFGNLLSIQQGQASLDELIDDYIKPHDFEGPIFGTEYQQKVRRVSAPVFIVRFDKPFRDLIERRVGPSLANHFRRVVFSYLEGTLRVRLPGGTVIAATEDPNQVLVLVQARPDRDLDTVTTIMKTTLGQMADWRLKDGYAIVSVP